MKRKHDLNAKMLYAVQSGGGLLVNHQTGDTAPLLHADGMQAEQEQDWSFVDRDEIRSMFL